MIGAFMVTYGAIFFLMGTGKILVPCEKTAVIGIIIGIPMTVFGIKRLKDTVDELENHK